MAGPCCDCRLTNTQTSTPQLQAGMGALSAHLGGAPIGKATARVVLGGCLAIGGRQIDWDLKHAVGGRWPVVW